MGMVRFSEESITDKLVVVSSNVDGQSSLGKGVGSSDAARYVADICCGC